MWLLLLQLAMAQTIPGFTTTEAPKVEQISSDKPKAVAPSRWSEDTRPSTIQLDAISMRVYQLDREIEALFSRATGLVAAYRETQRRVSDEKATEEELAKALHSARTGLSQLRALVEAAAPKGASVGEAQQWLDTVQKTLVENLGRNDLPTLFRSWWDNLENPRSFIGRAITLMVLWSLALRLVRRRSKFIPRIVTPLKTSKLAKAYIERLLRGSILIVIISATFIILGADASPIFAMAGALVVVVGLALKDRVADVAAGLLLLGQRPFDEGDWVTVAGREGLVVNLSLLTTTVRTWDNEAVTTPNNVIWNAPIVNHAGEESRRISLTFSISYGADFDKAKELLLEMAKANPKVLKDPEPVVRVKALNSSSVDIALKPWVRSEDYFEVYYQLIEQGKRTLDGAGIEIPFPQYDVHLHQAKSDLPEKAMETEAGGDPESNVDEDVDAEDQGEEGTTEMDSNDIG